MSTTSRVALLEAPRELRVVQHPKPEPGPREVLVHCQATALCHSDLDLYHGRILSLPMVFMAPRLQLTGHLTADLLILTLIFVPLVLGISTVLFALLERPFMDSAWPRKLRELLTRRRDAVTTMQAVENPLPVHEEQAPAK